MKWSKECDILYEINILPFFLIPSLRSTKASDSLICTVSSGTYFCNQSNQLTILLYKCVWRAYLWACQLVEKLQKYYTCTYITSNITNNGTNTHNITLCSNLQVFYLHFYFVKKYIYMLWQDSCSSLLMTVMLI